MKIKVFFCTHSFCVLLWKHMKERSRRLAHTVFEILCGVFIFVVLVCIKHDIASSMFTTNKLTNLNDSWAEAAVLFTPTNEIVEELMYKLAYNIYRSKLDGSSSSLRVPYISSYEGFRNESDLLNYITSVDHHSVPTFIISFKNMTDTELPLKLNYTITISDYSSKEMLTDFMYNENPWVTVEGSTALASFQWNVDKAFMEMLSGEQFFNEEVVMYLEAPTAAEMRVVYNFLVISTLLGPLSFYMFKAAVLVIEKREGMKELMKLHGVSATALRISHLADASIMGVIYSVLVTILLKSTSSPVLPYSNPVYVFVTLMLHLVNVTCLAFVTSSLSQDHQHSDSTAFLMYVFTCILDFMWYRKVKSKPLIYLICCILPHSPIYLFWNEVLYLESVGHGATFSQMFSRHSDKCTPLVVIWVFFALQVLVLNFLAWYLDLVRPGTYGVAAEWNFLCKKRHWGCHKKKKVSFHVTVEAKTHLLRDDRYFQKPPKKAEIAIKAVKLTKVYQSGEHTALDSVSIDALKGEVTMILGTNGAGKTTLMSIIAGMTSATQGNVYVNGLDTSSRIQEIRRDLGLCPQTDHTFKYLTVKENVTFFLRLKKRVANEEHSAENLLAKLNLVKKADYYSHQLSSGMKRCLQLACALVGDADVLVLDEPTTGMDRPTMHAVWDILMILRGPKTIIMTTVMMEEADALADRIALLHNGKLKCYGSPAFLKQALGNQINLDIALQTVNKLTAIKKTILELVPEASYVSWEHNILTYRMSSKAKEKLPALFDRLEADQKELGIASMEIGMSMEEIFLRFLQGEGDEEQLFYTDENEDTEEILLHGWCLWKKQLKILTKRTFVFLWTKKAQFITLQIVVPLLAIILATISANSSFGYGEYYDLPAAKTDTLMMVYDTGPFGRSNMFDQVNFGNNIKPIKSESVREDIKRLINSHEHDVDEDPVFGYSLEQNRSVLFHATHDLSLITRAVNAFSNVFLSIHVPFAKNSSIVTKYEPLNVRTRKSKEIVKPKALMLCVTWSVWIAFFATLPLVPFILFPIKEFHNGVRYNLSLSGCSPVLIWSSKLLAHFSIYFLVVVPCIIAIVAALEFDKTLDQIHFLFSLFLLLFAFGLAFLTKLYVLSFFLYVDHAISQMYIMSLVLGLVAPVFDYYLLRIPTAIWRYLAGLFMVVWPTVAFSFGIVSISIIARANAYCKLNRHLCPDDLFDDLQFIKDTCCKSSDENPFNYYDIKDTNSCTFTFIVLMAHFIINFSLILLLQNRVLQGIGEKISHLKYKIPRQIYSDKKVAKEIADVRETMSRLRSKKCKRKKDRIPCLEDDALIVENLHKQYTVFCGNSFKAVKGISFAVKKGECLGILGPNGAGKTTTLKMVAGFTVMTRGDCNVDGYFLRTERKEYLRRIAFTRERAGFDDFLTGYENLAQISSLYGRPNFLTKKLVLRFLGYMGLQPYSEMKVNSYSIGCSRRLAVCANLLACSTAGLLDEPTVSIDPHTKPLVVRAIKHMLKRGIACVVTEASMDWHLMECICSRIAIMCRGQLAAMGTAAEIRTEFGSGYIATIKLRPNVSFSVQEDDTVVVYDTVSLHSIQSLHSLKSIASTKSFHSVKSVYSIKSATPTPAVVDLKKEFEDMFETSVLREEHLTMLYYHIRADEPLLYSEMFTKLEALKHRYDDIIEDYTLSPATIEDVFIKLDGRIVDKLV